jgi:3-dehydroquinate dehydratase/shikimate dehydrogenase
MTPPPAISPPGLLRPRGHRLCVALRAATAAELLARAQSALADSSFLEFRLDTLTHPAKAIPAIAAFLAEHKEVAAIATCRRTAFGGNFSGTLADELKILASAAKAGCSLLDLEVESAEEAAQKSGAALENFRAAAAEAGAALLLSFHDFEHAPDPEAIYTRIRAFHPDYIKIVGTANSLTDSLDLLTWLASRSAETQLVAIAMGEYGVPSRILSLRAGAAFTFAAPSEGAETAPGQYSAHTLKELYRVEQIDKATRIYGVVGNPISHSLSPLMQNTAFHRERINAVYLPLKTESSPESITSLLHLARTLPLSGLSVTMPLKEKILPHLANVDPLTAKLGAANTIRMGADGNLYGFNTDVAGIVRPLERRLSLRGAKVLVLGAGGAARAAVFGLAERGAHVFLWSRKDSAARELAHASGAQVLTRAEIPVTSIDILINATPCGMTGNPHPLPLEDHEWNARIVFDLVYNPLETPLIKAAEARGITTIQGYEMFVHQGARQFELWTGKPAPEAEMLRIVLQALRKNQH